MTENILKYISYQSFFIFLIYIFSVKFLNKKPDDYITYFILTICLSISIIGYILTHKYRKKSTTETTIIEFNIINFLTHLVPSLYLLFNFNYLIKISTKTDLGLFKSILLSILLLLINLYVINSYRIYKDIWDIDYKTFIQYALCIILLYLILVIYINFQYKLSI